MTRFLAVHPPEDAGSDHADDGVVEDGCRNEHDQSGRECDVANPLDVAAVVLVRREQVVARQQEGLFDPSLPRCVPLGIPEGPPDQHEREAEHQLQNQCHCCLQL